MLSAFFSKRRWPVIAGVILALAAAIFLVTPPGQAWAESVLRFFSRGGAERSLPTAQPVTMVEVTPGSVQPTLTPGVTSTPPIGFYETCGDYQAPHCSLEQIRAMVDFPVKALAALPEGVNFTGATGGPGNVYLQYDGAPGLIVINQGPPSPETIQAWEVAEDVVVEMVQVGSAAGEYVQGGWSHYAGASVATWDEGSGLQTLRWQDGDVLLTMSVIGAVTDKTGMLALAQAMTAEAGAVAANPADAPEQPTLSIADAQQLAGFPVAEPAWLPEGYQLARVSYQAESQAVCLYYQHPGDSRFASLTVAELPALPALTDLFPDDPTYGRWMETATLVVGGAVEAPENYAYGRLKASLVCEGESYQDQVLAVQTGDVHMLIFSRRESWTKQHNFLTHQQQVRLAESITGTHTVAQDQLDPEFITSLPEAEALAGFPLKLPGALPEGVTFDRIRYTTEGAETRVTVIYTGGSQDEASDGNRFDVTITAGSTDTLEQLYNASPDIYTRQTVRGTDAILMQGLWDETGFVQIEAGGDGSVNLTWFEEGMKYSITGFNLFSQDVWLQIAESMR